MNRFLPEIQMLCAGLCLLLCMPNAFANESNDLIAIESAVAYADNIIAPNTQIPHSVNLDSLTEHALDAILSGDWINATHHAQQLVELFPDFALGQLILAEAHTVTSMSKPLLTSLPNYSKKTIDLLLEAQARVQRINLLVSGGNLASTKLPVNLIQVGKHTDHVILVDLDLSHLYLFDTTEPTPRLIKNHYISSGTAGFGKLVEGDLKTPLGVYRIHGFRSDDSLPPLYGSGALMLNFPNALDRALGKTGSGIWLHGNPRNNRSRSPRSSEGCVTMANDHLLDLYQHIDIARTKVVLSNEVQWLEKGGNAIQREQFRELFEQFRQAWLNNDVSDLSALYTPDALPSAIRHASNASTRKVSANSVQNAKPLSPVGISLKALSELDISDISLTLNPDIWHPDAKQHLVMDFELTDPAKSRVTFYWEQNPAGFWQIRRKEIDASGA